MSLQTSLGRRNGAGRTRVKLGRHPQRSAERLENRFALVVCIFPAQVIDVQSHQRVIDETLEKFMRQIDIECTDHRTLERDMKFEPGTSREIDDDPR